jgi:GNAT superfamily N-acetyltransferase
MIKITQNLGLQPIKETDSKKLYTLMKIVYPLAYKHFWKDDGSWYVESQYGIKNIQKELQEANSVYYFVVFQEEIIGNFRILWNHKLKGLENEKSLKLHRLYLHPKTQGNGIGKKILSWLEEKAEQEDYNLIWLDAMNEQQQAFQFYKKRGYKYHSHTHLNFELMHDEVRKMSQLYKEL